MEGSDGLHVREPGVMNHAYLSYLIMLAMLKGWKVVKRIQVCTVQYISGQHNIFSENGMSLAVPNNKRVERLRLERRETSSFDSVPLNL